MTNTLLDLRPISDQKAVNIGGTYICGATFRTATDDACEYGNGVHDCWNESTCEGLHQCCCGAVPAYIQNWLDSHEDTDYALAIAYLSVQTNGAVVCGCCGVNFNDDVDQD